eukprot:scaffold98762_cov69-Phaeocystis_antarctica.AAC.2
MGSFVPQYPPTSTHPVTSGWPRSFAALRTPSSSSSHDSPVGCRLSEVAPLKCAVESAPRALSMTSARANRPSVGGKASFAIQQL